MTKLIAKSIFPNTWILYDNDLKHSLLSKTSECWTLMQHSGNIQYKSLEELNQSQHIEIQFPVSQEETVKESIEHISQFPVNTTPFNINVDPFPTYTKNDKSKVRYAACYWGILFGANWSLSFCPKVETINDHETVGPFTTKVEANTVIAQKKRQS